MKQSTIKDFIEQAYEESVSDIAILTRGKGEEVGLAVSGDSCRLAEGLYTMLHGDKNPTLARSLYLMIKNIVYSIASEQSEMRNDLMNMLRQLVDNDNYAKRLSAEYGNGIDVISKQIPS